MSLKISAKALTALYPDTKFAGIKRTIAKVQYNVDKSNQETNLAIDSINKTFQAKMKIMSAVGKEIGGLKQAKEGGFEGGLFKWITTSPEAQKAWVMKGVNKSNGKDYETDEIEIPETAPIGTDSAVQEDKKDGIFKKLFGGLAAHGEEQRKKFKGNQGQKYDASIDEWIPPVEGKPDPSIGFGEKQLGDWLKGDTSNKDVSSALEMPTLDNILENKSLAQNVLSDQNANTQQRESAQTQLDTIDNLYSSLEPLNEFDLEEELYG